MTCRVADDIGNTKGNVDPELERADYSRSGDGPAFKEFDEHTEPTMIFGLAAVFGLSIGALYGWADAQKRNALPFACTTAILALGVVYLVFGPDGNPALGVTIGVSSVVGFVLALGIAWREHPALAGAGYWGRVKTMLFGGSGVRAHRDSLGSEAEHSANVR